MQSLMLSVLHCLFMINTLARVKNLSRFLRSGLTVNLRSEMAIVSPQGTVSVRLRRDWPLVLSTPFVHHATSHAQQALRP